MEQMCVNCGEYPRDYNGLCDYCQESSYREAHKKPEEEVVNPTPDFRPKYWPTHCKHCGEEFNKYHVFYEDYHIECADEVDSDIVK